MKKLKIAVLPGDGIGNNVTLAALPIFEALNLPIELIMSDVGWEFWKKEGNPVPERTWKLIDQCDATLLGAITSKPEREAIEELAIEFKENPPKYVSPVIQLRQQLNLFANIRPCFNVKEDGVNFRFCVIRENTEGLYAGFDFYPLPDSLTSIIKENARWKEIASKDASCSFRIQSEKGLRRLFEFAFEHANQKHYPRVTFADKPNVLRKSSAFAREIFEEIATCYPHIQSDILNVDAVALWMVRRPEEFGVIVAENMFGDILSDLGAGIMGGLGFAPSSNVGEKGCYFEPVHGSAPRVQPHLANPSAMFLTIALLLEHFGFIQQAKTIQQAISNVVKEGRHLTYDLGGKATTQTMAQAIINQCLNPSRTLLVSFLSTGNELIQGQIQDTNSHQFAKMAFSEGATIYQHIQVSDKQSEIESGLHYLLEKSDAVVVTGGLGPTSDDTTRYAIAQITKQPLEFSETAWEHVRNRLKRFNLPITDSNRQQALFPIGAKLYPNEHGTAYGCHLIWQNKHLFMLPGPPKECLPLFNQYVLTTLKAHGFFVQKHHHSWLTLGLIEGEIAPQLDKIASDLSECSELSYRWNYPYLEVKLTSPEEENILIQKIEKLLKPYLISKEGKDAFQMANLAVSNLKTSIDILDQMTLGEFLKGLNSEKIRLVTHLQEKRFNHPFFHVMSSQNLLNATDFAGTVTLKALGYIQNELKYQHEISVPNRGPEVMECAESYIAWQLNQFIHTCLGELLHESY